jgi:hypothetical protein
MSLIALLFRRVFSRLELSKISTVSNHIFDQMIATKHRGALSGVEELYSCICSLLGSNPETLYILDKHLQAILDASSAHISITRRSAGLPLILSAIVCSIPPHLQIARLDLVIKQLAAIASMDVDQIMKSDVDFPQVHALNMLRRVVATSKSVSEKYSEMLMVLSLQLAGSK